MEVPWLADAADRPSGQTEGSFEAIMSCNRCQGTGEVLAAVVTRSGATAFEVQDCPQCGGSTFSPPERYAPLAACRGGDTGGRE
jgi:hypothetical protein